MVSPQHHTLFIMSSYPWCDHDEATSRRGIHTVWVAIASMGSHRTQLILSSTRFVAPRGVFQAMWLVNLPTSSESISTRSLIGYEVTFPIPAVSRNVACARAIYYRSIRIASATFASSRSVHVYKRSRMAGTGSKTSPFNRRFDLLLPVFTRFHCITVPRLYRCRSIESNTRSRRVVAAIPVARTIRRMRAVQRRTNEQRAAMLAKVFQSLRL